MTPVAALVIRVSAIALIFGAVSPFLVFIDVDQRPRAIVVIGVFAAAVGLGAAFQLGLYLALAAVVRGHRAILVATALMLPTVALCAVQLSEFVKNIVQKGPAVLTRYPRSDLRLLAFFLVVASIYGWTLVALWRAYR